MQLSKTTEYAIRAMIYLETHKGVRKLEEIATEMQIPEGYLVKVMRVLRSHRMVLTQQGVNGGYQLCKNSGRLTLYDIMSATERTIKINSCLEEGKCALTGKTNICRTGAHGIYCELQDMIEEKIRGITLGELAASV